MKKTIILMLFVLGIALCPKAVVFAEDVPEDEVPELFDSTTVQAMVWDTGTVNLDDEPDPDPEPEPSE